MVSFIMNHSFEQNDYNIKTIMMNIEFNNLYTHFVFTTFQRLPLIAEQHRIRIEKYITGIVKKYNCKMYAIYANPEHVHFLVSRSPQISEETLATIVASSSREFINNNKLCDTAFEWQDSAAAFSVSKADVDKVCKYILNQPKHHKKQTYEQEYLQFIKHYQQTIFPLAHLSSQFKNL